jgi:hypothetical protein
MIYAYTLSENLNYQTEKWNLTAAYESFKAAVDSYGEPPLWVKEDSKANGLERYYDEGGQTVAMFLAFYKAGEPLEHLNKLGRHVLSVWYKQKKF